MCADALLIAEKSSQQAERSCVDLAYAYPKTGRRIEFDEARGDAAAN
jgi:hypothetical protein